MNSLPQFLELLAKSALVLTAAALLAACWHRASAAQRHTLWLAAFVALLLLPLSKLATPHWRLPGSPVASTIIMTAAPVIAETTTDTVVAAPAPAPVRTWQWPDTTRLLTGLWLAGFAALLAYRLIGSVQIARLRRRSTALDDTRVLALARTAAAELDLAERYEIRHATAARVPCTWGVRRPVILLPTAALEWNETRLLAALRHEFGHIARRDYLTRWLGYITCALYWPNPLVWLAARSLHKSQEQACDDLVLRAGTPASDYAALLFEAANASGQRVRHAVAMARPSTLEGRVLAIVDDTRNRRPSGRGTAMAGAFVVITALGISALAQVASDTPAPTAAAPERKPQIIVEAKFVEVRKNKWPESQTGAVIVRSAEEAAELLRAMESDTRTAIVSSPRVITTSSQLAQIQIGKEEKLSDKAAKPTFIGTDMKIMPTLAAGSIQLDVNVKLTSARSGGNIAHERDSKASVSLTPSQTLIMAGGQGEAQDRQVVIFIEARQATARDTARPGAAAAPPAGLQPSPVPIHYTSPEEIILPGFDFRDATVAECLQFFKEASQQADRAGDHRGVTFVHVPRKDSTERRIALALDNIPLSEALKYLGTLAEMEIVYEPHAIVVRPVALPITGSNITEPIFATKALTLASADGSLVTTGTGTLTDVPGTTSITVDPATGAASGRQNTTKIKPAPKPSKVSDTPIDIEAKEVRFENGVAIATGDVTLKHGNHTLTTNKLTYDPASKAIRVEGPSKTVIGDAAVPGMPGTAAPKPTLDSPKPAKPATAAPKTPLEEKASALIIPKLELRETTLQESVDFLVKKSRELDPDKKGIAISLSKDVAAPAAGGGPRPGDARITISLSNIPFSEALKYITSLAGTKFKYTDTGILIAQLTPEGASGQRP